MGKKITDFKQYIKDNTKIDSNGCWIWQKGKYAAGYGYCKNEFNKRVKTHRLSYTLFVGPILKELVCHTCDVPACCNPAHLFEGTPQDNMTDKTVKGRHRNGASKKFSTPNGIFKYKQDAALSHNVQLITIQHRLGSKKWPQYKVILSTKINENKKES